MLIKPLNLFGVIGGEMITLIFREKKNPRVRKMFVRNSGAGNGCINFMDAWKFCFLSAGKPPCP